MNNYDLTTPSGQQEFQRWVTELIRNEVNSYVRQVLFERNAQYIDTGSLTDSQRIDRLEQATFRR
jgi:hypothetical protein